MITGRKPQIVQGAIVGATIESQWPQRSRRIKDAQSRGYSMARIGRDIGIGDKGMHNACYTLTPNKQIQQKIDEWLDEHETKRARKTKRKSPRKTRRTKAATKPVTAKPVAQKKTITMSRATLDRDPVTHDWVVTGKFSEYDSASSVFYSMWKLAEGGE